MTEQYQQTNINQQRPAQYIDSSNADTVIAGTPTVTLGADATFILAAAVPGAPVEYGVLLPNVRTVEGLFLFFRNASGFNLNVFAQPGQVIDGNPSLVIAPTEVGIIVSDPVNYNTTPPTLPIGWTLIKNSAA